MAMQRAEDKTAQMQARAGAVDELIASRRARRRDRSRWAAAGRHPGRARPRCVPRSDVELELAKLKGALPAGSVGWRCAGDRGHLGGASGR